MHEPNLQNVAKDFTSTFECEKFDLREEKNNNNINEIDIWYFSLAS